MIGNETPNKNAHIIVIGNEKGGAGKTTTAMHIITQLLYDGHSVTSVDIDARQRSLSTYLENRLKFIKENDIDLPVSSHMIINKSRLDSYEESAVDERNRFLESLTKAANKSDFVVIDSPGNDTYLSRLAHSYADTVVTPINDSFVDLNVLASVDEKDFKVSKHGVYSEMLWEAKIYRAQRDHGEIDWIVLRNRLTNIDAHNKRNMATALQNLSRRAGCRVADGFGERVIYRELFLKGLTLLDIMNKKTGVSVKVSHIAARQELRKLVNFLRLKPKTSPKTADKKQTALA